MNINIYGTYLHKKLQNIDIVEHLHIKLWSESSISGVFLLIFLNNLGKLGHIINQRYKISKGHVNHIDNNPIISNASWSVINNFEDVNYCLDAFDLLFNEILDQHAPIRKVKVRTRPNPFVTEEIRGQIKTRDRWRKARKTGDPAAWSACKRDVKRELRVPQRSYVKQEIRKNTKATGNMWKVIPTCIPNKSTGKKCFSSDDKSVANNFNQLFTSVGSNAVTKIKSLAKENNYTPSNYIPSQLPFVPRSYTESEQFTFEPVECSSSRERPIL